MKTKSTLAAVLIIISLISCTSSKYIHDPSSNKRQKELRSSRSGNVAADIFLTIGSVILSESLDVNVDYFPAGQDFKNFKLVNNTKDTMFVNMLTDATWDNEDYCDFMDIRIPPEEKCKILVPLGVNYNVYFGTSDNPEKDEYLQINTFDVRKLGLKPGMTEFLTDNE